MDGNGEDDDPADILPGHILAAVRSHAGHYHMDIETYEKAYVCSLRHPAYMKGNNLDKFRPEFFRELPQADSLRFMKMNE